LELLQNQEEVRKGWEIFKTRGGPNARRKVRVKREGFYLQMKIDFFKPREGILHRSKETEKRGKRGGKAGRRRKRRFSANP